MLSAPFMFLQPLRRTPVTKASMQNAATWKPELIYAECCYLEVRTGLCRMLLLCSYVDQRTLASSACLASRSSSTCRLASVSWDCMADIWEMWVRCFPISSSISSWSSSTRVSRSDFSRDSSVTRESSCRVCVCESVYVCVCVCVCMCVCMCVCV